MPYILSQSTEGGKKVFKMKSKKTKKSYTYKSREARSKAMELHRRYAGEK